MGESDYRQYAILLPLVENEGVWQLLFEVRAKNLKWQPGEICFPGGRQEAGESLKECAIRETMEELKIEANQIEIVGVGDIFMSPFQMMIHTFVGKIYDYQDTFSQDEVDSVMKVPFEFFLQNQPEKYKSCVKSDPPEDFPYELVPGGRDYPWLKAKYDVMFYQYDGKIIWGMTAKMAEAGVQLIQRYGLE
jgi:8-oxo-dGTP pyrophosphatase MutT (NUDIX family)